MRDLIVDALEFASYHHRYQVRKGSGVPYISHPLDVCKRLAGWGITAEDNKTLWAIALLHDVVEDCPGAEVELRRRFGGVIAVTVNELTRHPETPKDIYLESFRHASIDAIVVKIADRLCNVEDFRAAGDYAYAAKYLLKASPVFQAFRDRESQIIDRWDGIVYNRIHLACGLGIPA